MKARRDTKEEDRFYELLAHYMDKTGRKHEESTFHVSDLLSPRQAYFKRLSPKPLTRAEMGYFLAGRAHGEIAEATLTSTGVGENEKEVTMKFGPLTIIGTQDHNDGEPVEFKTNRKWTIPTDPADNYVDQLLFYCALEKVTKGKIIVFYLVPGRTFGNDSATTPQIVIWTVKFSKKELAAATKFMQQTSRKLATAIKKKDHTKLPLCEGWMCGGIDRKTKEPIVRCKWYEECRPKGRYPQEKLG